MADLALNERLPVSDRTTLLHRFGRSDARFRVLTLAAALLVVAIFVGVIVALGVGAWPAFQAFGPAFFVTEVWNPVTEKFGAAAPIFGTLVTSTLAMMVADRKSVV